MKTRNLFTSHSWAYADAYDRLMALLRKRRYFAFKDYSVPRDDPIHNARSAKALRAAIKQQMAPCGAVLVLGGVYATYSKWIDEEISLAQTGFQEPKPIVAIRPRGNTKMSTTVQDAATLVVGWNTESIVGAIRKVC